jgi:cytochrome P450
MPITLPFDLTDLDNFADGFPHNLFEVHRREAPVCWHEPTAHTPDGEGFWSVATHAEILRILKDPETYSSERGGARPCGGTLLQDLPIAGIVLNMMDGPRHARIRRLVSTGLTPRTIGRLEAERRRRTRALLTRIEDGTEFDFLPEVAAELPMQAICILLGVPEDAWSSRSCWRRSQNISSSAGSSGRAATGTPASGTSRCASGEDECRERHRSPRPARAARRTAGAFSAAAPVPRAPRARIDLVRAA